MPDVEDFNITKPKWDSGLGYLFLLDDIIRQACGYLVTQCYQEYYNCLEAWYISSIFWFETHKKIKDVNITIEGKEMTRLEYLKQLREAASPSQLRTLKLYHEQLDKLSNIAGLRLASSSQLPGVLQKS